MKKRPRQRNVRYVDPGKTPLGSPRPLPVGPTKVAVLSRQLRRAQMRSWLKAHGLEQ